MWLKLVAKGVKGYPIFVKSNEVVFIQTDHYNPNACWLYLNNLDVSVFCGKPASEVFAIIFDNEYNNKHELKQLEWTKEDLINRENQKYDGSGKAITKTVKELYGGTR